MDKLKNIIVLSRQWALKFKCDNPWAAISVSTTSGDFPNLNENNRVDLLRLKFWDIPHPTQRQIDAEDPKLFNTNLAQQVIDFVDLNWDKIDTLLVHCEAGQSRSPAIATSIIHIKYGEGSNNAWFSEFPLLNGHVYRTMIEHYYGEESIEAKNAKQLIIEQTYRDIYDEPWDCKN